MVIAYAIGFILRFLLHAHPDTLGIFIAEYLFNVLSVSQLQTLTVDLY